MISSAVIVSDDLGAAARWLPRPGWFGWLVGCIVHVVGDLNVDIGRIIIE
jgi:hypothetical protein